MFRNPSLDTCIEVLRDNNYIVLEEEDAKKNLDELEEIYGMNSSKLWRTG